MDIDWEQLWTVAAAQFALPADSIHGTAHWGRVERHGVRLAEESGGDLLVVRLFAVFHDVCRLSDSIDDQHGARGAELAAHWRDCYFALSDAQFSALHYACTWHTAGQVSDDPTIGACWDADRLDLWRAGLTPKEKYMSTEYGRMLVRTGQVGLQYTPKAGL